MKAFEGSLMKIGQRYCLNDEQAVWFSHYFPIIENERIAKAMGVSTTTVILFARALCLEKSEKGIKAIRKRQQQRARKTNHKNGCYDRKRGKPVSEATMAGLRRRWEEEHQGLRENAMIRIKREDPDKYQEWIKKRSEERKESIRKERMRVMYGLPRQTNLKSVVMCPYKQSQSRHRSSALNRGYILAEDCSEGSEDRYVIYYDEETKRAEKFEENCVADGFQIREWTE